MKNMIQIYFLFWAVMEFTVEMPYQANDSCKDIQLLVG